MVDVALLASLIIVPILLILFNVLIVARYADREAAKGHVGALVLVVLLFFFAEFTVLLFSIDVGNQAGLANLTGDPLSASTGGFDIALLWQGLFFTIVILLVVIIPFSIFYYEESDEGDEPNRIRRCCGVNLHQALCIAVAYELVVLFIAGAILAITFIYASKAHLEISSVIVSSAIFVPPFVSQEACGTGSCTFKQGTLIIDTTFIVYAAALTCGLSNILFSIYLGVGLISLPYYGVSNFIFRPKILSTIDTTNARGKLRVRSSELFIIAEDLGNRMTDAAEQNFLFRSRSKGSIGWFSSRARRNAGHQIELKRLRVLSASLESDLEAFHLSDPMKWRQLYNPWLFILQLAGGILAGFFSLMWILHIILFMLISPPVSGFFNSVLLATDKTFPPASTLLIFLLTSHLLFSSIAGAFTLGTRIFFINVHQMIVGKTLLNSFFFNAGLLLLLTLPLVQFLRDSFALYAHNSDTYVFGEQFRSIDGFATLYQYNVFLLLMLVMSLLSILHFCFCPNRDAQTKLLIKKLKENIRKRPERREREIELTTWK